MKVVSDRLGHSQTAITSDLYTHVMPALAVDAAERMAALLTPPATSPDKM
jgi:integrase